MSEEYKPELQRIVISYVFFALFFIILAALSIIPLSLIDDQYYMGYLLLPFLLTFFAILTLFFAGIAYKSYGSVTYSLQKNQIEMNKYLFNKEKITLPHEQITNVAYTKTWILDKLFGTGSIYVHTAGSSTYDLKLNAVKFPDKVYQAINKTLHYDTSQEIDENGNFIGRKSPYFQKRLKPIGIIPTLGTAFGVPLIFLATGIPIMIITLIITAFASQNTLIILLGIFGIIALILIWLTIVIITAKAYKRRYYDFYTKKIEYYDGFLTRRKATVPMERITNISNNQSLFGIIIGYHTIFIETAGSSGPEITISYIKEGDQVTKELQEVLEHEGRN